MNTNPHNPNPSSPAPESRLESGAAEETLRLIASLPAPAGIEDRVRAALYAAPGRGPRRQVFDAGVEGRGRILAWPKALRPQSGWMRTAAAAAIVFVVAGGGWGVYTRVQQGQPAKVIVMPPRVAPGGFSGAGAMRIPQTLPGPVVPLPVKPPAAQPKAAKKPAGRIAPANGAASGKPVSAANQ
jgi:hypothetical protein